jgi:hypothetical protein
MTSALKCRINYFYFFVKILERILFQTSMSLERQLIKTIKYRFNKLGWEKEFVELKKK